MATIKTIQRTIAFLGGLSAVGNITTLGVLSTSNGTSTQWNNLLTVVSSNSGAWSAGGGGGGGAADWTYIANKPTTLAGYGITDAASSTLTTLVGSNSATWGDKSFSSITGKPTTLAGYGITDATSSGLTTFVSANSATWANKAFSTITGTPTTLAGYGITDAAPSTLVTFVASNSASWSAPLFAQITSTPTTLAGYGIVDAAPYSLYTLVHNSSADWSDKYWSSILNKPTTLAGYGITDAASSSLLATASANAITAANNYADSNFIPVAGGTISGSLSVLGTLTYIDTSVAVTSAMYIDTASSETALRVTQSGPGDAIRVEDSANPDTTPFIVKSDGLVGVGTADPNQKLTVVGNVSATGSYYGDGSTLTGIIPTFAQVTSKPTTLAGYGITDAAPSSLTTVVASNSASWAAAPTFAQVTSKPTTLAGYGITDAAPSSLTTVVANNSGSWNFAVQLFSENTYMRDVDFGINSTQRWADPIWLTSLNWSKITNVTTVTATDITAGSYKANSSSVNAQTGSSYTLLSSDNGKIITMNNAAANTVVVPSGLGTGFSCTVVQIGAGQVTLSASGVTLNSYQGYTKIAGQHAGASLFSYSANVFNLNGSLA
jgi:hypothetical protein